MYSFFLIPAKLHTDSIGRSGTPGLLIRQRWEVANYNLAARAVTPLTISSIFSQAVMPVSVRPWNTNSKQPIPDARHRRHSRRHSAAVAALIEPSPSPAVVQQTEQSVTNSLAFFTLQTAAPESIRGFKVIVFNIRCGPLSAAGNRNFGPPNNKCHSLNR